MEVFANVLDADLPNFCQKLSFGVANQNFKSINS